MSLPSAEAVAARARQAARLFAEWTGQNPEGVWSAPGRVNLIGEHLDYNGGHVLPFAIGTSAWLAVARRADGVVRVASSLESGPVSASLADLRHARGWSAYLLGTVWSLAESGVTVPGADLYLDSDLAPGAGLSSSAALEVAVAVALNDLFGGGLNTRQLASVAHRAETDVVGVPVGIMDQTASLQGREGHVLYLDCATSEAEQRPLPVDGSDFTLLLVDTGTPHDLRDGGYADRRRACETAARRLGVRWLAQVSAERLAGAALEGELARRARHVVSEEARVTQAAGLLAAGDLAALGPLMTASHCSQRDDFDVSTPALDAAVEAALASGAAGARLTGGGFGGTALILAAVGAVEPVTAAVGAALEPMLGHRPPLVSVEAAPGARRVL